jgi:TRAP-type C4-dicarboxylate transport system substrate-binding protein
MNRRQLALTLLGAGCRATAAQVVWKLATGYRADSFHTRNLDALAREVVDATNGALRIELHPDNTLAKLADIAPAVEAGRIEAGETIMSGLVAQIPMVWNGLKYFYEINAWFPKNTVFANARAFDALDPGARKVLLRAAQTAEARGWTASEAAAAETVERLRRNGMKIERASAEVLTEVKILGERFSLEWVRQVGSEANTIFIPYFTHS